MREANIQSLLLTLVKNDTDWFADFFKIIFVMKITFEEWKNVSRFLFDKKLSVKNLLMCVGIYEIPTHIQMKGIIDIIRAVRYSYGSDGMKLKFITGVGSGRALCEAFLNKMLQNTFDLSDMKVVATTTMSSDDEFTATYTKPAFMDIDDMKVEDLVLDEASGVIYISWLHNSMEKLFFDFVKRHKSIVKLVIISGEMHGGSCHSITFVEKMQSELGFWMDIYQTTGFCQNDHPFVINEIPMSVTTVFVNQDCSLTKEMLRSKVDSKHLFKGGRGECLPDESFIKIQSIFDLTFYASTSK